MTKVSDCRKNRPGLVQRGALVGLAFGLLPIFSMAAQSPTVQATTPETLRVGPVYTSADGTKAPEFPLLQVVIAQSGEAQAAPQPTDLLLLEDGLEGNHAKAVSTFDETGYGLAAVVAIDVSGSMAGGPLNAVRSSLYKFVSDARPQDSVGVMTIADDANWDVPFGTDKETTKAALQGLKTRGSLTKLYDGLLTALGGFTASVPLRRELTVISDGHDEGSQSTLEQVVQMAKDRGIAIDTVGLTRSSPKYLQTLKTLALETGGSFHQARSDQELEALIGNGMKRLKATPVAKFEAKHISGDGKQHKLGMRWNGASNLMGETTFVAPKIGFHIPRAWKFKDIPAWGYGVLALLCLLLLVAVILTIRKLKRRDEVADVPYELPRQPQSPWRPDSGELALQQDRYDGGEYQAGGLDRQVETVGMKLPNPPPKSPVVSPVAAPIPISTNVARNKQTRLAGVFDTAEGSIARLEILTGALSGASVEVQRGEFWIGAAPKNQFVISNDATVSSRHAYLIFESPILILVDNNSTNGTRINGKMLRGSRQPLHDGDQIQIGQTLLRLKAMG